MIPALLGAIGSIASGFLGANASSQAASQNYNMDLLNYYAREKERRQAIQRSSQQERETKLGTTDAQGNRSYFKPGVGWVVELSDGSERLADLYEQEELAQLENDLPKKRQILNSNVERQGRENLQGDALFNAFQRVRRAPARDTENLLNQASTKGITEGFDSTLQDAMQSSIRTGASNSGKVAADIGSARAKALADAFMNNKINARGQAEAEFANEQGNAANLYNMFATRASAMPDVAYNPRNIEGMTAQAQQGASGAQQNGVAALINALGSRGGTMSKIEPDYGMANAVGGGANALAAALESMGANKYKQGGFDQYAEYAGLDPKMYQSNRGAW